MGILNRIFGRKEKEEKIRVEEKVEKETSIEIEEENVIDLGWHWSEKKQEWQMA